MPAMSRPKRPKRPKRVAYLGPPGTYSDEAVLRYAPDSERVPYPSLVHVAGAVEDGEADEAVAPIENSIQGSITDILDSLIQAERTFIRGELVLTIDNCLLVVAEDLEKPGNLGAILRSADAAGAHGLILCDKHTDVTNQMDNEALYVGIKTALNYFRFN